MNEKKRSDGYDGYKKYKAMEKWNKQKFFVKAKSWPLPYRPIKKIYQKSDTDSDIRIMIFVDCYHSTAELQFPSFFFSNEILYDNEKSSDTAKRKKEKNS